MTGKIFNIQRFSIYDGPGIRTVIFFCGCNLRCLWCHNPESMSFKKQMKYNPEQCINCMKCVQVCENGGHSLSSSGHIYQRENCTLCMKCAEHCYAEALLPVGKDTTFEEVQKSIMTDAEYFKQSNGGVTFSGGEPMMQVDFLSEILKFCKANNIHTAVDTAGNVSFEYFEKILPYCDLFLYDIKAFDLELHKQLTGTGNILILENIKKLCDKAKNIYIRIPVIKNANYDDIPKIINFVNKLTDNSSAKSIKKVELLEYHELGSSKYKLLGLEQEHNNLISRQFSRADKNEMDRLYKLFQHPRLLSE